MKIANIVAVAAFIATGAISAAEPCHAEDAKPQAAPPVQTSAQDAQVGTTAQVFGKVISIHNVSMVGLTEPHVLVKLESAPGDVEIVDLGSAADLKTNGIEAHEGQQFWVEGRVGQINGKPLVVAEMVSESKLVSITRTAPLREESTKHADARKAEAGATPVVADAKSPTAPKTETVEEGQPPQMIQGSIIHTHRIRVEGEASEHMLAKVQTENGVVVLDMGSFSTLPAAVDLTEGKPIAVSGYVAHLNGKPIILAESVGNLSNIERSH